MQYLGALGYSDGLPIQSLLPKSRVAPKWSSQEGWQEVRIQRGSPGDSQEDPQENVQEDAQQDIQEGPQQNVEPQSVAQQDPQEDVAPQSVAQKDTQQNVDPQSVARILSSVEVSAFHKNVEAYLENTPKEGNDELLQLNSDLNALLRAALWEDKFDEIWSKDAPTGISFASEQEKSLVESDIPRVLAGAEPSNEYSKSFCNELMRWCEAYFQLYCGKDFAARNYPQWFTLSYRQE